MEQISKHFHSVLFEDDRFNMIVSLRPEFSSYNRKYSRSLLKYLKKHMKNKKITPTVKLQALKLLNSLMESKNPHIIEYCGKKFFNRFKIFAEFKKELKDERRGKTLFQADTRYEQIASEEFFILLLSSIKLWAWLFPVDSKGKVSEYKKLFDYLSTRGVTFIEVRCNKEKEEIRRNLKNIRKSMKLMMTAIRERKDFEKVKRIGKSIKNYYEILNNQISKYMDMEDHELIKELNETLDFLNNGQKVYTFWKSENKKISILDSPSFVYPTGCMFLLDISPKLLPEADLLSQSIQEISLGESFYETTQTEKELEFEKDCVSVELRGLGADYCRLKDQLSLTERNMNNYQQDLQIITDLYNDERNKRENLENENESLNEKIELKEEDVLILSENLSKALLELRDTREYCRNLEETVKNLEFKLKNIKNDLETKLNTLEIIEASNKTLEAVCKSLESQLENFSHTEKQLKKEIKELKNQETRADLFSEFDDRPAKSLRFSIIQPSEPLGQVEDIESPFPEDEDFMTAGGFISSRKPSDKLSIISNLKNLKYLLKKGQGLLYEDSFIQVSFLVKAINNKGICKILIKNNTAHCLKNLKTKLFSDPSNGLIIKINSEVQESLQSDEETQKVLNFECKTVFQGFPSLKLSYSAQTQKKTTVLMLPVAYTLFCFKDSIDFVEEWEAIDESTEYSTKTGFKSIKKLTRSILLSRNFQYAYIEGNGVIIASKSPVGVVLAMCDLSDSSVTITVKSKNDKLRDLVKVLLKMLLEP